MHSDLEIPWWTPSNTDQGSAKLDVMAATDWTNAILEMDFGQ